MPRAILFHNYYIKECYFCSVFNTMVVMVVFHFSSFFHGKDIISLNNYPRTSSMETLGYPFPLVGHSHSLFGFER